VPATVLSSKAAKSLYWPEGAYSGKQKDWPRYRRRLKEGNPPRRKKRGSLAHRSAFGLYAFRLRGKVITPSALAVGRHRVWTNRFATPTSLR
jgi:hypothetical protein